MTQPRAVTESTTPERADKDDDRVRLEADLNIAARVHRSMIPANQRRGNLEIVCDFQPMRGVGGDYASVHFQNDQCADEDAVKRLCANYIENVRAYTQHEKVRNKYTGKDDEPDERLMRSIEDKIDIPDSRKDDFRQEIMNYIGSLALDGKKFEYNTNARLQKALELKLFEDQRDTIKLKNVVSGVVDDETQAKIDVVKQRLIKYFGYNETSATDVLNYVASIFARGDAQQDEED